MPKRFPFGATFSFHLLLRTRQTYRIQNSVGYAGVQQVVIAFSETITICIRNCSLNFTLQTILKKFDEIRSPVIIRFANNVHHCSGEGEMMIPYKSLFITINYGTYLTTTSTGSAQNGPFIK